MIAMALVLIATLSTTTTAHAACSTGSFYNLYPNGVNTYPVVTLGSIGGWPYGRYNEDFSWSTDGALIATSGGDELWWLDVTSGKLWTKYYVPGNPYTLAGWISTASYPAPGYRSVFRAYTGGSLVRVASQAVSTRIYVTAFHAQEPGKNFRGAHLFLRYRSEDDYISASLWTNGDVVVKRQNPSGTCEYTQLGRVRLKNQSNVRLAGAINRLPNDPGSNITKNIWYTLTATVTGNQIQVYIDNVAQFDTPVVDNTTPALTDGLAGFRADWITAYIDDQQFADVL